MLFRMVSKAYIPSLIAIGDVVPNGTKMVPNLVWLIFSLFSTTFSCNIFRLDRHRKILFSKSADFVIFSDITNKMADVSDILYISTALTWIVVLHFKRSEGVSRIQFVSFLAQNVLSTSGTKRRGEQQGKVFICHTFFFVLPASIK